MTGSSRIQYWAGIYTDRKLQALFTKEQKAALRQCLLNPRDVDYELLSGYDNVFSIRYHDDAYKGEPGRIVFTEDKGHLVVLGLLPNHEYDRALKRLKAGVLKLFKNNSPLQLQKPKESADFEKAKSGPELKPHVNPSPDDDNDEPHIEFSPVMFEAEDTTPVVLSLDDKQQTAIRVKLPAVISGLPGSGKTTVALTLLNMADRLAKGEKILYITRSENLANHIKRQLAKIASPEVLEKVEIKTYEQVLRDANPNHAKGILKSADAIAYTKQWLNEYLAKQKKLDKNLNFDIDVLYQEFRIRSGFDAQSYCNLNGVGKKQSQYHDAGERAWVNQAYTRFMQELEDQNIIIADYADLPDTLERYATVLSDESQDLSHKQLHNVARKLAKANQVGYFYADEQRLEGDLSSKTYIMHHLYPQPAVVESVFLNQHYRCPQVVMDVGEAINKLRIDVTPDAKVDDSFQQGQANTKLGRVEWVGDGSDNEIDKIKQILSKNSHAYIITHADKIEEARLKFNAKDHQLLTPEQAKGLQYKTVIIYEPFYGDIFKKINRAVQNKIPDASYSPPLSQLFVSLTRAENKAILYSTIHRQHLAAYVKNAVDLAMQGPNVSPDENEPDATKEDYEKQAAKLIRADLPEKGYGLLRVLQYSQAQLDDFAERFGVEKFESGAKSLAPGIATNVGSSTSSKSTKGRKAKKSAPVKNFDAIHKVIEAGDELALAQALADGLSPNYQSKVPKHKNCSLVYLATYFKKPALIKLLAENGADLNFAHPDHLPPLCLASFQNDLDCVRALLDAGANLESKSDGKTALVIAVARGHKELVAELLKRGARINAAQDKKRDCQQSPLVLAATTGKDRLEIVDMLVEQGANVNEECSGDPNNVTPLTVAARSGDVLVVEALITAGAKVNLQCATGHFPLGMAAQEGNLQVVELLIKKGADLTLVGRDKFNALGLAFAKGHIICAIGLIASGASLACVLNTNLSHIINASVELQRYQTLAPRFIEKSISLLTESEQKCIRANRNFLRSISQEVIAMFFAIDALIMPDFISDAIKAKLDPNQHSRQSVFEILKKAELIFKECVDALPDDLRSMFEDMNKPDPNQLLTFAKTQSESIKHIIVRFLVTKKDIALIKEGVNKKLIENLEQSCFTSMFTPQHRQLLAQYRQMRARIPGPSEPPQRQPVPVATSSTDATEQAMDDAKGKVVLG